MISLRVADIAVELGHGGSANFRRNGMKDWLGMPVRILSGPYMFHFDLAGRIQQIEGLPSPHSWDWLERTMANDWIYYDRAWVQGDLPAPAVFVGDSAWAVNGRADLPMLRNHGTLKRDYVKKAIDACDMLISTIQALLKNKPTVRSEAGGVADTQDETRLWDFLHRVAENDREQLQRVADRLHGIRGSMLVLPPETIHVDYRVLLLKVMDGCINDCEFCTVRGNSAFHLRSREDIDRQIDASAEIYGDDLYNYNSVVLGECDAFASPEIEYAANRAFEAFRCGSSYYAGSNLFLFSTNQSLLELSDKTFGMLQHLPFANIYINVGWEAATDQCLVRLGKQQSAGQVLCGMKKAGEINRAQTRTRISGNFILADGHGCDSIAEAVHETGYCGQLYLSPLQGKCSTEQAYRDFHAIRNRAGRHVRVYLYTMQRL